MTSKPDKPRFRKLDGILLLDKPLGVSSNTALQMARKLFSAEKGGHTGSLDPLATGLLPLCFGEATKIAGNLLGQRKAYDTVARLGIVTDTDDAEGATLRERDVGRYTLEQIDAALKQLTGKLQQRPPIYSALKRGGEPLYVKARRGETIEVETRPVEVFKYELQSAQDLLDGGEPLLRLHVECGSGTYVRALVRDLGEILGCGAHVAELRRLWVEPFREPRMWTLDELQSLAGHGALDACLLPLEAGLATFPRLELTDDAVARFRMGQRLGNVPGPAGEVAVFDARGRAVGLAELNAERRLAPARLFNLA
ncbi:MAG: tRNA pseudouridine(55) synthase TruB [Pseudoxanthomonas sp.]